MASFFQPPGGSIPGTAKFTHFKISWNGSLSADELTQHWYQYLVISLGCCAFVLGCTTFLLRRLHSRGGIRETLWTRPLRSAGNFTSSSRKLDKRKTEPYTLLDDKDASSNGDRKSIDSDAKLGIIKSFRMVEPDESVEHIRSTYDLCIMQMPGGDLEDAFNQPTNPFLDPDQEPPRSRQSKRSSTRSISSWIAALSRPTSTVRSRPASTLRVPTDTVELVESSDTSTTEKRTSALQFGALSLKTGFSGPYAPGDATESTAYINRLRVMQGFDGFALSYSIGDSVSFANDILRAFHQLDVPVILVGEPDSPFLDSIDLSMVTGLIIQNPSIFPDGTRRDFYKADRLRDLVARCKRQRKVRSTFFIGFLDVWDKQPAAATLRRAYKLADFFGAVEEARPRVKGQGHARARGMCLSGFDWLKRAEIVRLQKSWSHPPVAPLISLEGVTSIDLDIRGINEIVPSAEQLLSAQPLPDNLLKLKQEIPHIVNIPDFVMRAPCRDDLWTLSSCGAPLCSLGCFDIRDEATKHQYDKILAVQRDLKGLRMLQPFIAGDILRVSDALRSIRQTTSHPDLLQMLLADLANGRTNVHKGLDSGFTLPDGNGHLWAVSEVSEVSGLVENEKETSDEFHIYISLKNSDDAATIWHTYLAHHGVERLNRFEEELLLTNANLLKQSRVANARLPTSIQKELETSTEAELLYLIEQVRVSDSQHPFAVEIVDASTNLLIRETSQSAWNGVHSRACLESPSSMESVLKMRLEHHVRCGADELPTVENLVKFYELLEQKIEESLFSSDRASLKQLSAPLLDVYNSGTAARPVADLYGLVFFCALRKLAFEDVYLETTDRCPLFLSQSDQAGVFAELWVLGSQCEIYFGVQPRTLGEVIYNRYRRRLTRFPPPIESWNGKEVFTAYSNAEPRIQIDGIPLSTGSSSAGPSYASKSLEWRANKPQTSIKVREAAEKLGALSIFCLPAIIDVLLLTFLGRGFYLTAFMDNEILLVANYAILTSLIMTGGVTGWVGSTGGFYMFSYAFDNMTHFLVQRFSAAFMLTSVVATCGFFVFGRRYSWVAGTVFVLYMFALTTFLNVLGMLSTMHRPGSPLSSGRIAMWKCLSILAISPILTTFVNGYDLQVYILVIYTFVFVLLLTFRNLCHEWTTWQAKVPTIKEKDLLSWYRTSNPVESASLAESPILLAKAARAALQFEVHNLQDRSKVLALFKSGKTDDRFVHKMAAGLPFALWLLEKESGGEELPEMFTTTWFVQLELALANQKQLTRGLKEHSPFITYRYSKYDLGQNVGLFLAALMDRFIDVSMSAREPSVLLYYDRRARYGICFGILYFLCGAVAVDLVLQHYWPYARMLSEERLTNLDDYTQIIRNEERQRRRRYRFALLELFTLLAIIFGFTTIMMWAFVEEHKAVILYFSATSAYTGVLVFQFHRCFTKDPRAHVIVVFCACVVGYIVGCTLRAIPSTANSIYTYTIGHNTATILAALGTFLCTGYINNPLQRPKVNMGVVSKNGELPEKSQTGLHTSIHGEDTSCASVHETNRAILRHLCLGIDADIQWSTLPEDVRCVILSRILGKPAQITSAAKQWLSKESKNLLQHDEILANHVEMYENGRYFAQLAIPGQGTDVAPHGAPELTSAYARNPPNYSFFGNIARVAVKTIDVSAKWTALISGAAPDTNRELWYAMRNSKLRPVCLWVLLKAWKLCWWAKNFWIYAFLVAGKQPLGRLLSLVRHGAPRTLRSHSIIVDTPVFQLSGFMVRDEIGDLRVMVYDGLHPKAPQGKVKAIAFYDSHHRLHRREVFASSESPPVVTLYEYEDRSKRWPISKVTTESGQAYKACYDKYGRIIRGKMIRGDQEFDFEFLYRKRPKGNSEVLQATYTTVKDGLPISISAFWCVKPRVGSNSPKNWIPSEKIQRVLATFNGTSYDMRWTYKHARGPDIRTSTIDKEGRLVACVAPAPILQDEFGFLKKPKHPSFDHEDLLIYHPLDWLEKTARRDTSFDAAVPQWLQTVMSFFPMGFAYGGKKVIYEKLSTSIMRTALWRFWGKAPFLDAVSACWLDEVILRKEPLLKRYWHLRDAGYLYQAADVLDETLEEVISTIEPSHESSQTCPLLIKSADLFTMGLGKDANQLTARLDDAYHDTPSTTSVIFSDNGCWPDNPGGVSNCRRDLVNGHTSIRGHCLAESANDFGIPRYQIERNVNSLKVLPLWGLDGKTPYHGVLDNLLQSQVDEKIYATKIQEDIQEVFIPLLKLFVRGARSKRYTRNDVITYSNVILKISRYFEKCDYNKTWNSDQVWNAWVEAWLYDYNDPNVSSARDYFEIEQPSMKDFRSALDLYICYFFIYSVEAPAKCPTVFQSTHHGISSLYGMLLKYRRGTTWGIWDHAILWRETCLNISPAQCLLPIPVQAMLLAGVKLACHLAYTHVDIVLPCTSVFNPDWEQDLGTDSGLRGSKKLFARKIDPIVNGIGNMDAFKPIKETRSKLPTTVMLSNVQFIKDVKNAVLAADIIINTYGFADYRLVIYGAQDRQPSYTLETETLINTRGLAGKVILAGFGSPQEVLKDAWIFMNSSLSEGLPLAIGEAALSGVPIVATEVGATALVLTDPDDITKRYGEVVPPNDPEALARAQLSILAMLGPWAQYTKDGGEPTPLPDKFTPEDVTSITNRMYEKTEDRRGLGLKLREVVLRSFHGHRYLREHEQMYWIQRRRAEIRRSAKETGRQLSCNLVVGEKSNFEYDADADTEHDARPRWQEFDIKKLRRTGQSRPQRLVLGSSATLV